MPELVVGYSQKVTIIRKLGMACISNYWLWALYFSNISDS